MESSSLSQPTADRRPTAVPLQDDMADDMAAGAADDDPLVHSPILDLLEEAFSDPSVTTAISEFCFEHASSIQHVEGEEHPLHYHDLFLQYTALLEGTIEAFLSDHNVSVDEIMDAARTAPAGVHTSITYFLASAEYPSFLRLMQDYAAMDQWCDDGEGESLE